MTERRRTGLLLAGLAAAVALSGCGSDTDRYCESLAEEKETLDALAERAAESPGGDVLGDTLEVFERLQDGAPRDLADEWQVVVSAWRALDEAFAGAGVSPGDFDPENPPAELSDEELGRLTGAAAELRARRVLDAGEGIEQHATDVCQVDLGLAG